MDDDDLILTVDIANNEGDGGAFYSGDDYEPGYEAAYDSSFYSESQQKVITILSEGKIFNQNKPHEWQIGAARNG